MTRPDSLPYKETLGDAIRWLAAKYPDRKLMVNREISLTFEEAERESSRIAKGLLARGLGKGMTEFKKGMNDSGTEEQAEGAKDNASKPSDPKSNQE